MRLSLAVRAFYAVLVNSQAADRVERAMATPGGGPAQAEPVQPPPSATVPAKGPPVRSEAITLLAALQREARLLDIVQEPLGQYEDAQVGAAARDVLRDCAEVLERMFGIQPVVTQQEGSDIEVPAGFDHGRYRLTGNVAGEPPLHGQLVHHGWQVTRCELPQWSGSAESAQIVAPIEVEIP